MQIAASWHGEVSNLKIFKLLYRGNKTSHVSIVHASEAIIRTARNIRFPGVFGEFYVLLNLFHYSAVKRENTGNCY